MLRIINISVRNFFWMGFSDCIWLFGNLRKSSEIFGKVRKIFGKVRKSSEKFGKSSENAISDHFPKISEHFPKISELFRRFPNIMIFQKTLKINRIESRVIKFHYNINKKHITELILTRRLLNVEKSISRKPCCAAVHQEMTSPFN